MAHFDLNKIIVRFKIKYPRFEHVVDRLPIELDDSVDTACTDGEKLYFNKEFMESLDEDQQLFTFAHEVLHVALNHIDRCLDKNMYYWNIATDAVINDYLKSSGLKFVDGCVDIEGALNQSAEELYEKLIKEDEDKKDDEPKDVEDTDKKGNGKPLNSPSSGNGDNDSDKDKNGDGSSDNEDDDKDKSDDGKDKEDSSSKDGDKKKSNVGHDDHSKWEDAAKKHKEEGTDNKNDVDEDEEFKKNDDEKNKKDDDYLKNGLNGQGSSSGKGSGRGTISGIETIDDTPICWQDLLKMNYRSNADWVTSDEIEYGVLIDDLEDIETSECEIVIDSSGSVSEDLIRNFLTECLNIAKNSKIKVGFFDTEFYGFHEIRNEDDIKELKIEGGGGTDFDCAVEAFTDSCENKIIFTDGGARMPDKEVDATWIVFDYFKHEINPKGGKVIYINGDEYDNLRHKHRSR